MYVSEKDLNTISELTALIDGHLESVDGLDEFGNNLIDYWIDFSKRTNALEIKMKKQYYRQNHKKQLRLFD
jgi:hypothetical protein